MIVSPPLVSELSCSTLFYRAPDLDIQVYNINIVTNHLSYFQQHLLDDILIDLCDIFSCELPHGLPHKHIIDHCIDFLLGFEPISISL